jgi:hypothetical protein
LTVKPVPVAPGTECFVQLGPRHGMFFQTLASDLLHPTVGISGGHAVLLLPQVGCGMFALRVSTTVRVHCGFVVAYALVSVYHGQFAYGKSSTCGFVTGPARLRHVRLTRVNDRNRFYANPSDMLASHRQSAKQRRTHKSLEIPWPV